MLAIRVPLTVLDSLIGLKYIKQEGRPIALLESGYQPAKQMQKWCSDHGVELHGIGNARIIESDYPNWTASVFDAYEARGRDEDLVLMRLTFGF